MSQVHGLDDQTWEMRIKLSEAEPTGSLVGCLRSAGHIAYEDRPETIELIESGDTAHAETIELLVSWWEAHPEVALELLSAV